MDVFSSGYLVKVNEETVISEFDDHSELAKNITTEPGEANLTKLVSDTDFAEKQLETEKTIEETEVNVCADIKQDALKSSADAAGKSVEDYIQDQLKCGILPGFVLIRYERGRFSNTYHGYIIADEDLAKAYVKSRYISDLGWDIIKENQNKWWQKDTYTDVVGFTNNKFRIGQLLQNEESSAFRSDITGIIEHAEQRRQGELNVVYCKKNDSQVHSKGYYCLENKNKFVKAFPDMCGGERTLELLRSRLVQNIELGKTIFN